MPEPISSPILGTRGVSKAYGPAVLFAEVALTLREGEKVGLIGRNGAGKSTLLRVLAGVEAADTGTIDRRKGASVLYLPQEPELDPAKTPRSLVAEGLAEWHEAQARHAEVTRAIERGEDRVAEQTALAEAVERLGGWTRGHVVEEMLLTLGVREIDRAVETMSGGEKRRVALARLLVARPTLAILDEPTNHLDADTMEWLEEYLATSFPGAVLLVTHDRYVLDAVCDRILELDPGGAPRVRGRLRRLPRAEGRAPRARGAGGGQPIEPASPGDRVAAPRRQGAVDEAEGPHPARRGRSSRRRLRRSGRPSSSAASRRRARAWERRSSS